MSQEPCGIITQSALTREAGQLVQDSGGEGNAIPAPVSVRFPFPLSRHQYCPAGLGGHPVEVVHHTGHRPPEIFQGEEAGRIQTRDHV